MEADRESAHWRARISYGNGPGARLGAGTMLDLEHVLTCAHVLPWLAGLAADAPAEELIDRDFTVTLINLDGSPEAEARLSPQHWVPVAADESGDIAVLRLRTPLERARPAPLRRSDLYRRQEVRTCGFPAGADTGYWVSTHFAGRCGPGGIWMQLAGEQIGRGFSGAAVIDAANRVVGMCVAQLEGSELKNSYMMPVEAMSGALPDLRRWISGPKAVDDSFTEAARSDPASHSSARRIAGWLAHAGAGEVEVLVTGPPDSSTATALGNSVVLADRERPRSVSEILAGLPEDAVPSIGSIDLAVDAGGRTAEQVRARIADRLGIDLTAPDSSPRPPGQPRTVIVTAIDQAADPAELVQDVLVPLIRNSRRWELRLILGFHAETAEFRVVRAAADDIPALLAGLERAIADLATTEAGAAELYAHLSRRVTGLPEVPRAAELQRSALRLLESEADRPAWVRSRVRDCLRAVDRDAAKVRAVREELLQARDRRDELRGELATYRRMAGEQELTELYDAAARELWEKKCDLGTAAQLVADYVHAVMARIAEQQESS
ncbi:MAG TPA: trypsin-like peptidase domain-containing protein [Mycobacteriales bacterium]|nr:trypsin-like peptidase domain-containing protein [Mycobacteriales bacterium]